MAIKTGMKNRARVSILSGGQDSYVSPEDLQEGFASKLENVTITEYGRIKQRLGLTLLLADAGTAPILGLGNFKTSTVDWLLRQQTTKLERLTDDGASWVELDSGFTTGLTTNFVQVRDQFIAILNGTDNVHTLDTAGSVTDQGNTNVDPPKSTWGEFHDGRLHLIDSNGDINFSDILDETTFDRTYNIIKPKAPAVCIKSVTEKSMLIYSERYLEVLNTVGGDPLTQWQKVFVDDINFISPRTVKNTPLGQVFLCRDGIRLTSGQKPMVISRRIQDIINGMNQAQLDKAHADVVDNKYILAIPMGTSLVCNKVIIWDFLSASRIQDPTSGWVTIKTDDWTPSCFTSYEISNVVTLMVGEAGAHTYVYKGLNGTTDNGTAITSIIEGPSHFGSDPAADKIWGPLEVKYESGINTSIGIKCDLNENGFLPCQPSTMSLIGSAPVLEIALPFALGGVSDARQLFHVKHLGRGRTCMVQMSHSTSGATPEPNFLEYTLYWREINTRF